MREHPDLCSGLGLHGQRRQPTPIDRSTIRQRSLIALPRRGKRSAPDPLAILIAPIGRRPAP